MFVEDMERPALADTVIVRRAASLRHYRGLLSAIAEPHNNHQWLGEPVVKTSITHVAMDTHKKQHQVAWVHPDTGEIQEFTVPNRLREIERMVKKIRKQAPGEIHICYEAGLCGFVLKRRLDKLGCVAKVIAPSLVWRKPGDRVKTDRRDAKKLLAQFVAGQLTEVFAPDPVQEADRELTRCRESAQTDLKRARQRLNSLLVRVRAIRQSAGVDGISGSDSLGRFQRREPPAGGDHQDGQSAGPADPDGGGVALPSSVCGEPGLEGPSKGSAGLGGGPGGSGGEAIVPSLPASDRTRQGGAHGDHGGGAGTGGLCVGHASAIAAATGRPTGLTEANKATV